MARRLLKLYTQVLTRPYRVAFRYFEITPGGTREVIETYKYWSYGDLVAGTLEHLAAEIPDFLRKTAELDDRRFMNSPHKTRHYLAERKDLLYINSPHLTDKHSRKIDSFWIATNIGRLETRAVTSMAAAVAGIERLPISQLQL